MTKDPVCGMEIDKDNAGASTEYEGQQFYFCSDDCLKEFEANPELWQPAFEPSCHGKEVVGEAIKA